MLMYDQRCEIVSFGRKASSDGLCPGTSGNISVIDRQKGLVAISPSGIDYFDTRPEDVPICDLSGKIADGHTRPSSELALHLAFYREKPDIGAVVHTHSVCCTVFASLGQPIRAVHYVIGDAGTDIIPCAPYRLYGTAELSELAVEHCGRGNAVLLENHGIVCCGSDLRSAYSLAKNLEYVAQLQYMAMCIGKPHILTSQQMDEVMEKFKSYGQNKV